MSIQLLERVMALGKELGYTGVELLEWVTAQVNVEESKEAENLATEERRLQREEEQRQIADKAQAELLSRQDIKAAQEAERQEKLKREEMARAAEEAERQERIKREEIALEQAKLEQQERLRMLELEQQKELKLAELKLAEKKLENDEAGSGSDSDANGSEAYASSSRTRRGKSGPKLPSFDENKDNIDSYLRRFERYATLQRWPKDD